MKLKYFVKNIYFSILTSDLHVVEKVSTHLQERTEENADCKGKDEGDDDVAGIILLGSSADSLHQKLVSRYYIGTYFNI